MTDCPTLRANPDLFGNASGTPRNGSHLERPPAPVADTDDRAWQSPEPDFAPNVGCSSAAGAPCTRGWLQLALTPGLGPVATRRLRQRFGCACAVLAASTTDLRTALEAPLVRSLLAPDASLEHQIEQALEWAQQSAQHLLTPADPRYPATLAGLTDAPPVLYLRGDPEALNRPALAVVGSRNASRDGLDTARQVAAAFARAGIVIVSGLAAGIDSAAHRGALSAGGLTVGFLGTGADQIYPRAHRALAEAVIAQGALVSELPLGSPAQGHHFPRRNRLIAAHAVAVVVVQAARHSGSLITARLAAESGREVMAFPGSIHSPLSKGSHQLIREGAALVEDAAEIAELLGAALARQGFGQISALVTRPTDPHPAPPSASNATAPDGPARRLLTALGWAPAAPDALARSSGLDGAGTAAALLELELAGQVERLIDGRFQRRGRPAGVDPATGPLPAFDRGLTLA